MIETEQVTGGGAVPTIWNDLLRYLDDHPTDTSTLRSVVGGSACPPALRPATQERHDITVIHAWGMTETSPLGRGRRPPGTTGEDHWRTVRPRAGSRRACRHGSSGLTAPTCRGRRVCRRVEAQGWWVTWWDYDNGSTAMNILWDIVFIQLLSGQALQTSCCWQALPAAFRQA